jgi:type IX secretion system PorP/SprF family membrane protein
MKRGIVYIIVLLILGFTAQTKAQILPLYSQYVLNAFMVNPAVAGHDGYTSFNTSARQQWLGFSQAPRPYSASWQTRVLKKSYKIVNRPVKSDNRLKPSTHGRVGLGAYLINDVNANVATTGISFTYAYHIFLGRQQLSFGLAGKAFQYRIYEDQLTFGVAGDPVLNSDFKTVAYSPDADFGVYFQDPNYFVGLSVSNLFQTSLKIGGNERDFGTPRHYWAMGAYRFRLSDLFELEPGVLLKSPENWNPQGDFTLKLYVAEQFWGGLSYRTSSNSMILLLGVKLDGLYFGYSFDWTFSEIGHFSYGSHEIVLAYKIGDNARRYKWLNRY